MKSTKLLVIFLIIISGCKEDKKEVEKERPSYVQTVAYLKKQLTDGPKVDGFKNSERSLEFYAINDFVYYRSNFKSPEDNTHWEQTQEFPFSDISRVLRKTSSGAEYLTLELNKRSNHRITRSMNSKPINPGIPVNENLDVVLITVSQLQIDGVEKAFKNIIALQRENTGANYFEN